MNMLAILGLPLEIDHAYSYFAAVFAAMLLVPCLTILLTAIEAKVDIPDEDSGAKQATTSGVGVVAPPGPSSSASPSGPNRWKKRLCVALFFPSCTIIAFLFLAEFTNWNKILLGSGSLLGALVVGSLSTLGYSALFSKHPWPTTKRISVTALKEAFAITGIIFALYSGKTAVVAMTRGANSNAAAVAGQLSQSEARIDQDEANDAVITTMYFSPSWWDLDDWKKSALAVRKPIVAAHTALSIALNASDGSSTEDHENLVPQFATNVGRYAKNYWLARLATSAAAAIKTTHPEATSQDIFALVENDRGKSVASLNAFTFGADSGDLIAENIYCPNIRTAFTKIQVHAILVLNQLHVIDDYIEDNVIRKVELEGWIGYTEDLGPHPIIISTLYNWLDKRYCTKEFFTEIRSRFSGRIALAKCIDTISKRNPASMNTCNALRRRLNVYPEAKVGDDFYGEAALLFRTYLNKDDRDMAYDKLVWLKVWEIYLMDSFKYRELVDSLPSHEGR